MAMSTTTLEERMTIVALSKAGHSDTDIAERIGWSVSTVRKWRRREAREGRAGLATKMGRPASGAMSTFTSKVEETLRGWRKAHPGWGPVTLRTELEKDKYWREKSLPSRPTIARWLHQKELTRPYERHQDLPQPTTTTAKAPHEEWELDARGHGKVPEVGVVALLNMNDRFSRTKLLSYPCLLGKQRASRHATTEDYQVAFRLAASEWGLPDRLFVDRDSVFYDNSTKSPFPTRLHLWFLALGIELVIGPPRLPQKRAITERSHQIWYGQVLKGPTFATWEELRLALERRRDFMNESLPCASLEGKPPLVAYPQACIPRREYRPEWETDLMDLERIYVYLAQGKWFRKGSNVGAFSLGDLRYSLGKDWIGKDAEITFDLNDQHLVFRSPEIEDERRVPIKGISKTELIGELGPLVGLDHFQLALPFTWHDWRVLRLYETIGSRLYET
jgi:transposase